MPDRSIENNPLHGITLKKMVTSLLGFYGWDGLAARIKIRCFQYEPSLKSSLKFLRRTPWARQKVEELYLYTETLREQEEELVEEKK